MKHRKMNRVTSVESLEGRELLSGAASSMAAAQARAARAAQIQQWRINQGQGGVPQGTISTHYTTPKANGAVSHRNPAIKVNVKPRTLKSAPVPTYVGDTTTPYSYNLNPVSGGYSATNPNTVPGYAQMKPGSYPMTSSSGAAITRTGQSAYNAISSVGGSVNLLSGLPVATGSPVNSVVVSPASVSKTTPTTTGSVSSGATAIAPTGGMVVAPGAGSLFGNVTMSQSDVASFKSAIDAFAGSYTGGTNTTTDQAAADTLRSALNSLNMSIWSENHVASPTALANLNQTVKDFSTNYTAGANLAQDTAAWKALQDGLAHFNQSVSGNGADPGPGGIGMNGMGVQFLADSLLSGPTLSTADATTLKTAVDTFATNYTSGSNTTADQAAMTQLQTDLANFDQARWTRVFGTGIATAQAGSAPGFGPARMPMIATPGSGPLFMMNTAGGSFVPTGKA